MSFLVRVSEVFHASSVSLPKKPTRCTSHRLERDSQIWEWESARLQMNPGSRCYDIAGFSLHLRIVPTIIILPQKFRGPWHIDPTNLVAFPHELETSSSVVLKLRMERYLRVN